MDEKEIHFTKKRVDETWKQGVLKDEPARASHSAQERLTFANFVTSLGLQALMNMGDIKAPGSERIEVDLDAAKETIDLLVLLKEKTKGNLTNHEESLMTSLIADLQLKFVQHKKV